MNSGNKWRGRTVKVEQGDGPLRPGRCEDHKGNEDIEDYVM